jgi:hypothetical protein
LEGKTYSIVRNGDYQTEVELPSNYSTKLKIEWIDDCTYKARIIESNFPFPDSINEIKNSIVLKVRIISGNNDYYIYEANSNIYSLILKDTMWLAK